MRRVSQGLPNSVALQPYAQDASGPVRSLRAGVAGQADGSLALSYTLDADLGRILVPEAAAAARTDELWKHTCFEAFIASGQGSAYCELNFAPSSQWAAYSFDGYRRGMRPLLLTAPPAIRVTRGADRLELEALVHLGARHDYQPAPGEPLRIALAAVIEDNAGRISYWALRHAASRPDFHHPGSFTFELAP